MSNSIDNSLSLQLVNVSDSEDTEILTSDLEDGEIDSKVSENNSQQKYPPCHHVRETKIMSEKKMQVEL